MDVFRQFTGLPWAAIAVLSAACQGTIQGPLEERGPDLTDEQRPIDDLQRATNPQLFEIAGQGGGVFQTNRIVDAGGRSNNDLLISVQNASGIASNVYGLESLRQGPIV